MRDKLAGELDIDQIKRDGIDAKDIIQAKPVRDFTERTVSEKILVLGAEYHLTENKIRKTEQHHGKRHHHHYRPEQVPAQFLQVTEEGHFLAFACFISHAKAKIIFMDSLTRPLLQIESGQIG
jgi:hypothetical protein